MRQEKDAKNLSLLVVSLGCTSLGSLPPVLVVGALKDYQLAWPLHAGGPRAPSIPPATISCYTVPSNIYKAMCVSPSLHLHQENPLTSAPGGLRWPHPLGNPGALPVSQVSPLTVYSLQSQAGTLEPNPGQSCPPQHV